MDKIIIEPHKFDGHEKCYYVYIPGHDKSYLMWDSDIDIIDNGVYFFTREFVERIEEEFGSMEAFKLYMEIEYR